MDKLIKKFILFIERHIRRLPMYDTYWVIARRVSGSKVTE
jgi:hypothetical protein